MGSRNQQFLIQVTPVCLNCHLTQPVRECGFWKAGWASPSWGNLLLLAEQLCFAASAAMTSGASPVL